MAGATNDPVAKRDPLREWWRQFRADVFGEYASIQPLAGWLLLALLGLVAYLTLEFAPGAFERARMVEGADRSAVISVETGYWTIAMVALLALLAGFEPHIASGLDDVDRSSGRRWLGRQPAPVRASIRVLLWTVGTIWRLPSSIWSFLDYLLARPLAFIAGATQRGTARRYTWGAAIILGSLTAGLLAPAPFGLYAIAIACVAVLAIVRRWSWAEADRERFLIERGERQGARRIGFDEDLRDEALIALTFLLVLIPLGLHQIQRATCAFGMENCAFTVDGRAEIPGGLVAQFVAWVGYFGAELAKAVPFVDWSEVFRVANDSPIKPRTTLGAQVAFAMRAMIDLLLLAAVLQAVRIAGRLRNQRAAFEASRLPILEPFAEARELHRAGTGIEDALDLAPTEQHSIATFPLYDAGRLQELVRDDSPDDDSPDSDPFVRKAAVALLARQHAGDATDRFFTEVAGNELDPEMRRWVLNVASGLAPEADPNGKGADRAHLNAMLADRWEQLAVRTAAARALGRMGPDDGTTNLLLERLQDRRREDPILRAHVGVALSKLQPTRTLGPIEDLVSSFEGPLKGDALVAAMATAYALARLAPDLSAHHIAERFDGPLRQHVLRTAGIQPQPMDIAAARDGPPGTHLDQLVRIAPGEGPFPHTFQMGTSEKDDQTYADERPPCDITVRRAFALGRYPVTQEEYLGFCLATGRQPLEQSHMSRWPAASVSWRDAIAYCSWLERITGERYRLPSETEWEYACRAGTTTRYSWSDDWDNNRANSNKSGLGHPSDVGTYDPNKWGLWDMHGNVFEWCADPYHDSHVGRPSDGSVWLQDGDFGRRVIRGGSWDETPSDLRSALRNWNPTDVREADVGFRVAKTLL